MRQTAAEIDHAILDVAAGIFAIHGFAHTSVQQIADAVGYSKPGLLHRFGSKEALHRAVLAEVSDTVQEIVGRAVAHGEHPAQPDQPHQERQVRPVLELMTVKALDRPGMVQMMLRAFESDGTEPGVEAIQGMGLRLVDALDRPSSTPADRLRVVLSFHLVSTAARKQHSTVDADVHVDREQLVPMIVSLAADVLGHGHAGEI